MHPTLEHSTAETAPVPQEAPEEAVGLLATTGLEPMLDDIAKLHAVYYKLVGPDRLKRPIERQVKTAETKLGITTRADRALESLLCIDQPVLSYAVITGSEIKPERLFGDDYWADHLDARYYLEKAKGLPLDVDLIIDTQALLTQRSAPEYSGVVREEGATGGRYDDPYEPATFTKRQIEAIESHSQLTFSRVPEDNPKGTTGYICYPYQEDGKKTAEAIREDLSVICDWYNQTKAEASHDPYALAAELQQRLITLHPFLDGNGRASRLLMNWSLMNDGLAPSFLDEPNADLTSTLAQWQQQVKAGSVDFDECRLKRDALAEAGIHNIPAVLGMGEAKAFYDYVYRHLAPAAKLVAGEPVDHIPIEAYVKGLREEWGRFNDFATKDRTVQMELNGPLHTFTQAGLLSSEFIQVATNPKASRVPSKLTDQLLGTLPVYRGGGIEGKKPLQDKDLLSIFQGYTAFDSGYRALDHAWANPRSLAPMPARYIKESLEFYNQALAGQYLAAEHPEVKDMDAPDYTSLRAIASAHVFGSSAGTEAAYFWASPFVSTTAKKRLADGWARKEGTQHGDNGLVLEARLPAQGPIATSPYLSLALGVSDVHLSPQGMRPAFLSTASFPHESEREILVPGAIMPAAIEKAWTYTYDPAADAWGLPRKTLLAERVGWEGKSGIDITDFQKNTVRRYVLDAATGAYALESEKPLQAPAEEAAP